MSRSTSLTRPDLENEELPTQASFYTDEDQEVATRAWPKQEVEDAFRSYRSAVDVADRDRMAEHLTVDGRGRNATFGFVQGRDAYRLFLHDRWPETVPNHSMWVAIHGGRVVNKWCEVLPGERP